LPASQCAVVVALGQAVSERIGERRYHLWFHQKTKFTWGEDRLIVGVPNHFYQEWLQKTFVEAVRSAAQQVLGRVMEITFAIDPELFQAARREQAEPAATKSVDPPEKPATKRTPHQTSLPAPVQAATIAKPTSEGKRPRRWHRLGDFVVGPNNGVAHASALSIVESPGQEANPLVLHGPVGTGKTHLLEGIYAGLRKQHSELQVRFSTAEEFTNRFVQAMRLGKLSAFRQHYRQCDALLVDDIDFLASKRATQEEFLHTFDALQSAGRQIVLTCDCHPRLADEFTPELGDRLLGGAVWGLTPPDADTRLGILRMKSSRHSPPIGDDVLQYVAGQLRGNVRELEGALHTLQHVSRVTGRPVELPLAREALADFLRHAVRVVHIEDVDRAVCEVLRLEAGALHGKQRSWAVSHPRMVAMYLARKHTNAAYSEIGRHFGGRNHSTAVAAEKKVRGWLQGDDRMVLGERRLSFRQVVEAAERLLAR
jgi:chromosomal replication initiator protein